MLRRIIALFLALLMTTALISCVGGEDENLTTTTVQSGDATTPEDSDSLYDKDGYRLDRLPERLDFKGETIKIFYWSDRHIQEFFSEGQNGENINDAIFTRNLIVTERLNNQLDFYGELGDGSYYIQWTQKVVTDVNSGTCDYDIVAGYSQANALLSVQGYTVNLMEYDNIFAFDLPWWPEEMVSEATIGGKLCFVTGDISTNLIAMLQCTYFNKNMLQELNLESPYELVLSGKWTIDKLISMSKDVYNDLNGNGTNDDSDIYGFTISSKTNALDTAFYGAGLVTMEKDSDDLPVISDSWNSEKTSNLLAKIIDWFYKSGDVYTEVGTKIFADGRCLFEFASLNAAFLSFNEVDFYGIVPAPKYDEYQEDYVTGVSYPHTLYSISTGTQKQEHCAYLLECLASAGHRLVTPEVFNITLKHKYASDEETGKMLDILRASVNFDVGRIYAYAAFNNVTLTIWRSCIANNNGNFATAYKAQSKAIETMLQKFRNDFGS